MRRILVGISGFLALAGLVLVCYPLISSVGPSERAMAEAPILILKIDLSEIPEGESREFAWNGLPVVVLHRTKKQIDELTDIDQYRDHEGLVTAIPDPEGLNPTYRSFKPQYFVAYGWTGNTIQCRSDYTRQFDGYPSVSGGFLEVCRGAWHDVTGRLLKGSWTGGGDLPIPPYRFIDDKTIKIGPPNEHVFHPWHN